jgi:hypothetical protein
MGKKYRKMIANIPLEDPAATIVHLVRGGKNVVDQSGCSTGNSGRFVDNWKKGVGKIDISKFASGWMGGGIKEVKIEVPSIYTSFFFSRYCS